MRVEFLLGTRLKVTVGEYPYRILAGGGGCQIVLSLLDSQLSLMVWTRAGEADWLCSQKVFEVPEGMFPGTHSLDTKVKFSISCSFIHSFIHS